LAAFWGDLAGQKSRGGVYVSVARQELSAERVLDVDCVSDQISFVRNESLTSILNPIGKFGNERE
jgi:hypothetical protein